MYIYLYGYVCAYIYVYRCMCIYTQHMNVDI